VIRGKRHPCWNWCAGQIQGIVENQQRLGEISESFTVEIRCARGLTWVPAGAVTMTCRHNRDYIVIPRAASATGADDGIRTRATGLEDRGSTD
jgi:hypothetical protein